MWGTIVSVLGALISSAFAVIGTYNWARSSALSLPIPALANLLAAIIPLLNYLCLLFSFRKSKPSGRLPPIEALGLLAILDSILVTLASSQLPQAALSCSLDSRWRSLFQAKNSRAIRNVQDRFNCCGFVTAVDKAWPFPDHDHGANACMVAFDRARSCLPSWRKEERMILAVMITVGALSLVSKLLLLVLVRWRPQLFGGYGGDVWRSRGRQDQQGERQLITGQDEGQEAERLYFDDPAGEVVPTEHTSADGGQRSREAR